MGSLLLVLPYFSLHLLLLLLTHFPSYTFSLCNPHDSSALLQFKNSFFVNTSSKPEHDYVYYRLNGCPSFSFKTESWKINKDCCQWDGVTCDNVSDYVIGLDLSCNNLVGELHPNSTVFQLRHLQQLNLAFNNLHKSSLLDGIGDLVNLRYLNLSTCGLSGNIPSTISRFSNLVSLDLSANDMDLNLFTWNKLIHNLTNLRELYLDTVNMSSIIESSLSILKNLSSSLVSLSLASTQLCGNLSSDILSLPNIRKLDLSHNKFSGNIQIVFENLIKLEYLDLSGNKLIGPIPSEITKHSKLRVLYLGNNMLNGTIPYWCYNLPSLVELHLNDNHLTGFIDEFSTYSLNDLDLSNNNLHGHFPNSIFKLQYLTYLVLSSTNLSGIVHFHQFSTFKYLYYLNLSHNSALSINIDSQAKTLPNLGILDLSNNNIHGKIPKWFQSQLFSSWKNIKHIDLSFNKLQGDLPIPPYGIIHFLLSNNNFTGDIALSLCNASSLQVLNLAHNNLTGTIPQCLGTFPSLFVLDMQMNNFYGSMPRTFSKQNNFETIKLNDNQLEGQLPQSLAHCTKLEILDLGNNNIDDAFPNWLETLQELKVLSLRSNKLHGKITCSSTEHSFSKLRIFDISHNNLSGPVPTSCIKNFQGMIYVNDDQIGPKYIVPKNYYYYNDSVVITMKGFSMELTRILTTFTIIDLSNNMLEGEIPHNIGELIFLKGLNLSNNEITDNIPQSLCNLRNLEWLDLSKNQLIGEIPMALTNLTFLSVLNLSQNHFEGIIPTGQQFDTFGISSYEGNTMLCGFPLSKSCKNDEDQPPHSTSEYEEESGFGWKVVVTGYVCGAISGLLFGYNVFFIGKPVRLVRFFERMFDVRLKRTHNRSAGANRRRVK